MGSDGSLEVVVVGVVEPVACKGGRVADKRVACNCLQSSGWSCKHVRCGRGVAPCAGDAVVGWCVLDRWRGRRYGRPPAREEVVQQGGLER